MTTNEMSTLLIKGFWCFETFTETNQEFAERVAIKNALKHCLMILESDPSCEHMNRPGPYQNRVDADSDFWESVAAILQKKLDESPV